MTRYADDNGLPSRIVRDVIQDNQGFIWVAGNNGLYKFDGKNFQPYLASLKDITGLRDNKINAVLQTSDDKIWIGTPRGLHVLENDSISYVSLVENPIDSQEHVLNLFEDAAQNLWVGTYGGLFLVEKSNEVIHLLSEKSELYIAEEVVWGVNQGNEGKIWVAGNDGPYVLEENTGLLFKKINLDLGDDLNKEEINFFGYQRYSDSLVLVPSSVGLLKGTIKNDSTLRVTSFLDVRGDKAANYFIECATIDNEKNIWIGTFKNYFKKFKIVNGRLEEQEVLVKNGLLEISGNTKSVYEDSQSNIWLANTNGLYKLSKDEGEISTFPPRYIENCLEDFYGIYAMIEDKGGHLWITTPTKLYRFSKSDVLEGKCPEEYLHFEDKNMQLSRNLYLDSQYRLWIGAHEGLFVTQLGKDHNPGKFYRYTKANGLPRNWSFDIHEIDPYNFWVGNYAGLVKMTLEEGNLENPKFTVYTSDKERTNGLVNSQANDIESDARGNIWIGTFSGVSKLIDEDSPGTFQNYTSSYNNFENLSNNSIKKLFRDSQNRLWIATQRGLNLFEPQKDRFIQLGNDQGLPSEYVLGINEDSKGFFWIGTTNGVIKAKYDAKSQEFTEIEHFTSRNGLVDNIPYRNSILIDVDDNVFIGSREGISVFNGTVATVTNRNFNMAITYMESTQKKKPGFKSIMRRIKDDELILSHFENSVKISYAALDFLNPENNMYRHKLLPANENWIETGNSSELSYYNLASGGYELILDGGNNKGVWSKSPISLKFTVNPPFWKSTWAILLYVLLGAALLRFLYLLRIGKKVRQLEQETRLEKALLNEREQLRQENAADFHDELGSKVTKISLFLTLAERSLNENDDPLPWFAKIRDNVKGLSGSFRDLLWVIDPQKDSLDDTFLRLKDFGEDLFERSEIDFRTSRFEAKYIENFLNAQTKKQVVMIFKEAMTNCLKHSKSKKAELKLDSNGKFTSIELIDDGNGFNVGSKSKGRGLRNMMERAKKINALLNIETSLKGTTISLHRIPHMSDRF